MKILYQDKWLGRGGVNSNGPKRVEIFITFSRVHIEVKMTGKKGRSGRRKSAPTLIKEALDLNDEY